VNISDRVKEIETEIKKQAEELGKFKNSTSGGKTFTRSQINEMSIEEYEQNKEEIDRALREGRING